MPEPDIARYKYILDEILRLTDDGFIVVDPQGVVTDINEQYCDFLGRTRDEVVGYPITKVIKNSKMIDIVRRRYSEELALHKYVPGDTKANDDNFVLVSRSCVFDDADQVVAGVAQVKFRLQTLDSAKRLMSEYAELEFYREEYQNYSGNQYSFEHIVGSGERFLETKRAGLKAAKTDFAVLLTGETGTGKEVFARAIHNNSPRSDKPMVSINCAAIPSELLESELFGYAEGAFTGAKKGGKKGKFQMANGGTLFLDEIGDMPLHMQAKILRVLQEGEVEPVGGSGPEPVDVRILSATRKNLTEMIQRGEFREDLYYRLNVLTLNIPPLRDCPQDIMPLTELFVARFADEQGVPRPKLSADLGTVLMRYGWPGNIRQLKNAVYRALTQLEGYELRPQDILLPDYDAGTVSVGEEAMEGSLDDITSRFERSVLTQLYRSYPSTRKLAKRLGVSHTAIANKLREYGLNQKKGDE